jgi:dienelactone hydrolase
LTAAYTKSFSLEKDGFVGELYTGIRCPGKAILYVGGAGCKKKMTLMMGQFLVDAGFTVLFLGFYLWDGLSKDMWNIPVDYAQRAAIWLKKNGYDVCMIGTSTGAGYTLLSASLVPEIGGVVALSGFDHVMEGCKFFHKPSGHSVYEYRGEEYPFSHFEIISGGWAKALRTAKKDGVSMAGFMRYGYEKTNYNPKSRIRVEDICGDILFLGPTEDSAWPSDAAEKRMMKILQEAGFRHHAELKLYDSTAHGLGVGKLSGIYKLLAGFAVKEDSAAAEDARLYVISWLDRWAKGDL